MSLSIRHALVALVVQVEGMLAMRERPTQQAQLDQRTSHRV